MNEFIPHLSIESLDNGNLRLENETVGDGYVVDLHPTHVRLLAERLGLIASPSEPSADQPTLAEQARDIDRLTRNTLRVRQHALQLQHMFRTGADWVHADLSFEMGLINSLVDLLDMAVDDFVDDFTPHDPAPYVLSNGRETPSIDAAAKQGKGKRLAPSQALGSAQAGPLFEEAAK